MFAYNARHELLQVSLVGGKDESAAGFTPIELEAFHAGRYPNLANRRVRAYDESCRRILEFDCQCALVVVYFEPIAVAGLLERTLQLVQGVFGGFAEYLFVDHRSSG